MMRTRRKRVSAITAVFALIGSLLVGFIATAGVASASTSQNNACLGVTGTFSTFPIPITGTASPNPVNAGATTTLSGTGVTIAVDSDTGQRRCGHRSGGGVAHAGPGGHG